MEENIEKKHRKHQVVVLFCVVGQGLALPLSGTSFALINFQPQNEDVSIHESEKLATIFAIYSRIFTSFVIS